MRKTALFVLSLAGMASPAAWSAPGDYEPAYDQAGGYGTATLDERVSKLEKKVSGESQMEMLQRIEQLQGDVTRLRGEVEDLTHQLEATKKQQKDMYLDLDRRLQPPPVPTPAQPAASTETPVQGDEAAAPQAAAPSPAQATPSAPAPSPAMPVPAPAIPVPPPAPAVPAPAPVAPAPVPAPPEPVAKVPAPGSPLPNRVPETIKPPAPATPPASRLPPPIAPSADSAVRQAAYQKGFNVLKEGRYPEAIKEFKSFLATYPKGEYSENAQYWLAEAHYVNQDRAAAKEAFRKLIKEYPGAAKASDAQLKLGYIDYDSGQWAAARESLGEVIKRYPGTSAANLAQKRLDKLKQEGH